MSDSAFLFDSNIWVALAFDAHPGHGAAIDAFGMASKARPACFCRATQQSFLRLASTPVVLRAYGVGALTNADAVGLLDRFMENPSVSWREEPKGIEDLWPGMAKRSTASPKVWMDAYLAAFAIAGALTFVTANFDFAEFKGRGLDLVHVEA